MGLRSWCVQTRKVIGLYSWRIVDCLRQHLTAFASGCRLCWYYDASSSVFIMASWLPCLSSRLFMWRPLVVAFFIHQSCEGVGKYVRASFEIATRLCSVVHRPQSLRAALSTLPAVPLAPWIPIQSPLNHTSFNFTKFSLWGMVWTAIMPFPVKPWGTWLGYPS